MIFDIIVLAILGISALIAFLRGFIRETLTILGMVGGVVAAYFGSPYLLPSMRNWLGVKEDAEMVERLFGIIPYPLLAEILTYGLIFLVVVIVLSVISHILAETVRAVGLGPIDRTLGVMFGLARGILLLGILYLPFHVLLGQEEKDAWFQSSKTFFYVEQTASFMAGLLPEETLAKLQEDTKTISEGVDARQRLQDMTSPGKEEQPQQPVPAGEGVAPNDGYNEQFRQNMDQLFENKGTGEPGTTP